MISRAGKYLLPVGAAAAVVCLPTTALCAKSSPGCVYDEPPPCQCPPPKQPECRESELEKLVAKCRKELAPLKDSMGTYTSASMGVVKDIYGNVKGNICYLRTRAPEEVRIGTVVAGGFLGLLAGFRKGLFRKVLFGGIGALGGAYLAYPCETVYYAKNSVPIAQKYVSIAYKFVVGGNNQDCCPRKCGPAATVKSEKAERNMK